MGFDPVGVLVKMEAFQALFLHYLLGLVVGQNAIEVESDPDFGIGVIDEQ